MNRLRSSGPEVTLFMLMSVDGKISTGSSDAFDFDVDLPYIPGVKEGLHQYYDLEKETDTWTITSGRTIQKVYKENEVPDKLDHVNCVVIDSNHLTCRAVEWLGLKYRRVYVVSPSPYMTVTNYIQPNVFSIVCRDGKFSEVLTRLHDHYGCDRITLQGGGTLNAAFFEQHLVDYLSIVVAPVVIGGKSTSTIVDGIGLSDVFSLDELPTLELVKVAPLQHNYLHLVYRVRS